MTLDEFIAEMHRSVDAFKTAYLAGQIASDDPKMWPDRMNEGDWYEQWLAHVNGEDQ